jgi:hypothetical protein
MTQFYYCPDCDALRDGKNEVYPVPMPSDIYSRLPKHLKKRHLDSQLDAICAVCQRQIKQLSREQQEAYDLLLAKYGIPGIAFCLSSEQVNNLVRLGISRLLETGIK